MKRFKRFLAYMGALSVVVVASLGAYSYSQKSANLNLKNKIILLIASEGLLRDVGEFIKRSPNAEDHISRNIVTKTFHLWILYGSEFRLDNVNLGAEELAILRLNIRKHKITSGIDDPLACLPYLQNENTPISKIAHNADLYPVKFISCRKKEYVECVQRFSQWLLE